MEATQWVRALRESELQEAQLIRNKRRNGHQEADGERAREENKEREIERPRTILYQASPRFSIGCHWRPGSHRQWVRVSKR